MANIVDTLQTRYNQTMKTLLAEFKGGRLRGLAEKQTGTGNETVRFYRSKPGSTTTTIDMYAPSYTGVGGDINKIDCSIAYNYWHEKLKMADINSTSLTVKDQLMKSGVNSLAVSEDVNIANVIVAGGAGLTAKGSASTALAAQIPAFIGAARVAYLKGQNALDATSKVAILMNETAYEEFFSDEKTINSLYTELSGIKGEAPNNFHYCEIIALADTVLPAGTCYFVPAGSFGFAAWEDSAFSDATYHAAQDSMFLMAKSSWGAVLLDPKSIFAFAYQP